MKIGDLARNNKKKWMMCILTSSDLDFLERAYQSVLLQRHHSIAYDTWIVVNTMNTEYLPKVLQAFADRKQVHIIRTESNGSPGKGHNSVFELFRTRPEYGYLCMLDGDDMFYPTAFQLFQRALQREPDLDILHLMINDNVTSHERPSRAVHVYGGFKIYGCFDEEENFWRTRGKTSIGNPFEEPLFKCKTPSRILVCSRRVYGRSGHGECMFRFCERSKLYDDFQAWMMMIHAHRKKWLRAFALSNSRIYCYNGNNWLESATYRFTAQEVQHEQDTFNEMSKPFRKMFRHWNQHQKVPFLKLGPPKPDLTMKERLAFCKKYMVDVEIRRTLNRGNLHFRCGKYSLALESYQWIEKYGIAGPQLFKNLAMCFHKMGDSDRALLNFEKVCRHPIPHKNKALLHDTLGYAERAARSAQHALFQRAPPMTLEWLQFLHRLRRQTARMPYVLQPVRRLLDQPVIAIYVGHSGAFNGANYEHRHVYGSEIAAVKLSEQLALRGYRVFVFGPQVEPVEHRRVKYLNLRDYMALQQHVEIEHLIVSRFIHFFLEMPRTARHCHVWLHDARAHEQWRGNAILPGLSRPLFLNLLRQLDSVVCVSKWHHDHVVNTWSRAPPEEHHKFYTIGNGLDPTHFQVQNVPKKINNHFVYCSDTSRGLDNLLALFPRIQDQLPDATLDIFFSVLRAGQQDRIAKMQGVRFRGKVSQQQLARELMAADAWLYPNTSHETFCCAALEAMAAGCVVMCRRYSGLVTTVSGGGVLIDGDPKTEKWHKQAVNTMVMILKNEKKKHAYQKQAQLVAHNKTWARRAVQWCHLFKKVAQV